MKKYDKNYVLVENDEQLNRFYSDNKSARWLAFDTEFIPEKYYKYKLCVISAATNKGNYVIDVLKVKDLSPFLKMVANPAILKITHAGENDYRILVEDYDVEVRNVFDTQLSHGFLHHDYPLGLLTMAKKVLRVKMDKGQLRSDWEKRPLTPEQCKYAIEDVIYLHPLMLKIKTKLKKNNKLDWAIEENKCLEDRKYYMNDPLEFLSSGQVQQFSRQQKVFFLRIHMWRHLEAEKEDRPVNMILKTWVLNAIVQQIESNETSLLKDRTLPTRFIHQHLDTFRTLYKKRISPHEQELLDRIPEVTEVSTRTELLTNIMHQLVKFKGLKYKVAPKIIISGKELTRMKAEQNYVPAILKKGWRLELLGKDFCKLLGNRGAFDIEIKKDRFTLYIESEKRFSFKNLFRRSKT
ncbi:MAG: hypothetical protein GY765_40585 [bacterium]|nr:hypothetical protein [bacterium]